jgi:hypothetical protein
MTGWDALADLQLELQSRLSDSSLPSFDGQVDSSAVPINDPTLPSRPWDRNLLRALYAVAQNARVPAKYLDAIRADAALGSGAVSQLTFQTGMWVGQRYYSGIARGTSTPVYGLGTPDEVMVPGGTVLPSMSAPPPVPTGGTRQTGATCNVAPTNLANLTPISQTIEPFQFNPLVVFTIAALAVGTIVFLARDVPVTDKVVLARHRARRSR